MHTGFFGQTISIETGAIRIPIEIKKKRDINAYYTQLVVTFDYNIFNCPKLIE